MMLVAQAISVTLGGSAVLDDANVAAKAGEIVAVLGPNGAGKSTLLRALAGLIAPTVGRVTLEGRVLAEWERDERARQIAYLPQERLVHWPLSVRAVVALGRLPHRGRARAEGPRDVQAVARAIATMDLEGLAERPVTEISGGELARTLMARALAQEAGVLLADEPTAGLDPAHQLQLFERLRSLAAEGRAVVVALHDLSVAARYCHRVVLLRAGRVIADGAPSAVLTEARLAEVYGIRARLATIEGSPIVVPLALSS
jgi:iron complex transport system ATP-binding protein